jgi:hypothetical protein
VETTGSLCPEVLYFVLYNDSIKFLSNDGLEDAANRICHTTLTSRIERRNALGSTVCLFIF